LSWIIPLVRLAFKIGGWLLIVVGALTGYFSWEGAAGGGMTQSQGYAFAGFFLGGGVLLLVLAFRLKDTEFRPKS
jgi:hypothetical protein